MIYLTQALLDLRQWNYNIIYIIQIFKINHYSKKHINSSTKMVDAEGKTNGNNVGSQEQQKQLTSNENMIGYCEFTMQSLMECYEIVGGLKQ